jgi:hypothetical protein
MPVYAVCKSLYCHLSILGKTGLLVHPHLQGGKTSKLVDGPSQDNPSPAFQNGENDCLISTWPYIRNGMPWASLLDR